ncbi:MAG: endo-1,4-beta-xylanase [Sedimentisphaerales bacterium]|nr:endo-1,4-beta-xylanase [Sedimentisphaerales bacterium]
MRTVRIFVYVLYAITGPSAWALTTEEILNGADKRIDAVRKADATLTLMDAAGKPLPANVEVRIEQTRHKFLFGSNIFKLNRCRSTEDEKAYRRQFAELLNYATLPFYWWNYTPRPDEPDDARTEGIIAFCKEKRITMKGHPLAWNWADPRWLPDDPTKAMELQLSRIDRCIRRFDGSIDIWDVVNEATHYDRPGPKERSPKLTRAIAQMGVGEYVRQAFQTARKANPDAVLVINDYRTDPEYADKVLSELVDQNGKPMYDVIGIQSHMHGGYWGAKKTWEVCEYFARFNKPLHFTEVTVVSGPRTEMGWKTMPEGEARQARQVAEFYTILFSHPAVEAITWWDFSDQNAWQGAPAGFLRDDMSPKPVYEELHKRIKGQWWTKTTERTNSDGQIKFRGFLGDYNIIVDDGMRILQTTFSLDRQSGTSRELRLN